MQEFFVKYRTAFCSAVSGDIGAGASEVRGRRYTPDCRYRKVISGALSIPSRADGPMTIRDREVHGNRIRTFFGFTIPMPIRWFKAYRLH